jgi:hypothetical protein
MRCPRCSRSMLALFYSAICESCAEPPHGAFYAGYVVWDASRSLKDGESVPSYVWRTAHEAVLWRSLREAEDLTIRCVLSEFPIPWHHAGGKAAGLVCADALFEIYPDHRFRPDRYRAFLSSPSFHAHAERVTLAA